MGCSTIIALIAYGMLLLGYNSSIALTLSISALVISVIGAIVFCVSVAKETNASNNVNK